ncbi:trigger factor [Subdoligranulum sp. DSM 109015]|uniref:peptidylprolyl isomerase n=1 Tax=Gemmiger gallinarum TaxID=2779354 RepID=A0ABR9R1M5_9FIRM|nr:trigger factor [Gemmiger gallinarum]MBE5037026.1 trigger factor [Gemmiger gallinarum]
MKLKHSIRAGALMLALSMVLVGCSKDESQSSTSETSSSENAATSESATAETADAYAYLANFSFSDGFDENGYLKGIKALDYVTLPEDYNSLTLPAGTDTVTDEDVDSYIETNILSNFATDEQVTDRAAEMGDTVNIDYVGSVDGVEFDGGSAQGYDLTLGSGSFIDDFEDQIAGHTPGETFNVEVTFPDPYQNNPDLAGKEAVFVTTLNYISESVNPELTDAWVAENINPYLELTTVDSLKTYVHDSLVESNMSNAVYQQLVENTTFAETYPESATQYFNDSFLFSYYIYAANYGMTLDEFVSATGYGSAADLLTMASSSIENSMKQALLMQAIAEQEGVVCDDAALDANINDFFSTDDTSSYITNYGENYIKTNVLQDLLMKQLVANATVAAA